MGQLGLAPFFLAPECVPGVGPHCPSCAVVGYCAVCGVQCDSSGLNGLMQVRREVRPYAETIIGLSFKP